MNKLNYLILLGIIPIWSFAQQITINPAPAPTDGYTVDYLINEILIEGDCAQVDNIASPMNSSVGGENYESFGYFEADGAPFPFENGIVLASNDVSEIPSNIGAGSWPGDDDLLALTPDPDFGTPEINNATVVEFDFVPFVNEISFNYLMASNEYTGSFPCNYEDIFAFIISGPYDTDGNLIIDDFPEGTPGVFQPVNSYNLDGNPNTPDVDIDLGGLNIATLPGTNILATVTNIHNLTTCGQGDSGEFAAAQFFDTANSANGSTDYNGQTVPLTASADVIAGQIYKIKLAIGDSRDSAFNSAVFIEGESFTLGDIDLGDPITLEDPEAQCTGLPITLDTGLPSGTEIVFEWYFGEVGSNPTELIEGEESPSLDVSDTGSYAVFAFIPGPDGAPLGCFNTGVTSVEFFDTPEGNIDDGFICVDGQATLDATPDNLDTLLDQDPTGPSYTWFLDGDEIAGETEAVLTAEAPGFYEVEIDFNTCLVTLDATLTLVDYEVSLGDDVENCVAVTDSASFEIIPEFTDAEESDVSSYAWSTGETTPTIMVDQSGTYSVTTTVNGCEETDEVEVVFLPIPDVSIEDVAICDDGTITLDATPTNIDEINAIDADAISYTWFQNGTELAGEENVILEVSEPDFYSVEVNFFDCSTTAEAEVFIENYMVGLGDAPLPCILEGQSQEFTIVPTISGVASEDLDDVEYAWSTGETTPNITVTESGTYSLTTTLNGCEEFDEIEVQFVQAHEVFVADEVICFDEGNLSVESGYNFENADEIIWETPNGTTVQDQSDLNLDWNIASGSSVAENEIVGMYTLTVIISECEVSTTFDVDFRRQGLASSTENTGNIIDSCSLPQGISPNGDGVNDCFDLSFLASEPGIKKLQIFNRYGRKVFESSNYTNQFCGQDDGGNNLVTGTYFFVLDLEEAGAGFEQVEKGWVYINREQQ
ncbi:choice-of-anchor L domain-containing protein [Psychroflexus planctonicus]|uniref:T9SS C-terminal target domain-containing protein n=1 Tax=Psychroflexus planctonicus TaxID=1526575 RepID=A0ABQ1SID0_9FLAO|nr:choice-of-anchor L domain-containing protein [Psychroflexus planctonicus]GGE41477.1 T9SS C-terminal target domain-containing protein [Psychroflexus planctonicus]